jgi:hypothetical protein
LSLVTFPSQARLIAIFEKPYLTIMKKFTVFLCSMFFVAGLFAQERTPPPQTQVMTLGTFHFAYPNLDAVKTAEEDQISVLDEPYQSEIRAIARAIMDFRPTIIAVESLPENQARLDSLYKLYRKGEWTLQRNEIQQLGFRIAAEAGLERVWCVDDQGRNYDNVWSAFRDSTRMARLSDYWDNFPDSAYLIPNPNDRVSSIIEHLISGNDPEHVKKRLGVYLLKPFKYEETPGDFFGTDWESGRWFNRNLRIFRNIQRTPFTPDDRILVIVGREHLNLLNPLFDASPEFELVSPLPYLEQARRDL